MKGTKQYVSGNSSSKSSIDSTVNFALGYLFRRLEEEINHIAMESGEQVTGPQLARRLAALLEAKASGQLLGDTERVSEEGLLRKAPQRVVSLSRKTVDVRSHGRRSLSQAARNKIASAQRARWKKTRLKRMKGTGRSQKENVYAKMRMRIRQGKNLKVRAKAIGWFKRNYPDSVLAKAS